MLLSDASRSIVRAIVRTGFSSGDETPGDCAGNSAIFPENGILIETYITPLRESPEYLELPTEILIYVATLSMEGKEKLHRIRPRSIGQASRISGVTNSDVSVLSIFLKQLENI